MIIKGTAYWAKVLRPVDNYNKDGLEYTVDLTVDSKTRAALEEAGLGHKIAPAVSAKGKEHVSKSEYIKITVPTEITSKGKTITLRPPKVKDKYGRDWDTEDAIGNGSVVDVMFDIRSGTLANGSKWAKPSLEGVRVIEHVKLDNREEFDYEEPTAEEVWGDDDA